MRQGFGVIGIAIGAAWLLANAPPDDIERAIIAELNFARANPRDYAEELRDYRGYFEGRVVYPPDDPEGQSTREGVAAVDDAIRFLERQPPLPALDDARILDLAARDHADDQGATGAIGHVGRNGSTPGDRVRRRGGDIYVGEVISYGQRSARAVVRQLIVNDGVPGRGHRQLVFSSRYRFAGAGCGTHPRQRTVCVVKLSATPDGNPVLPTSGN
ncbi:MULTISPECIES: CAP domain-containing protein [unclassified Sphingomonas]|jgi:uncharacterized protein YkwD|uniref:CAP domain-containing protein n=1 Tax=unclassified Sphingomonas TaxID=196159 RepID=UPI00082D90B6|nr:MULTISPECIES: CAP domain-containing protein [unclassified Sphingomonas]